MSGEIKRNIQDSFNNNFELLCISILIEAPKNHLKHRSEIRILSKADFNSRWRSIKQDLLYIKNNQKVIEDMFEYIIYNGDDRAKCDTYYELRNIVREL